MDLLLENHINMPYGMLHNNFDFTMTIDGKKYINVTEYLYVNLFRNLLHKYKERLKLLKLKGITWVDKSIENPESCDFIQFFLKNDDRSMYEKFQESVDKFCHHIMIHHYTKVLTDKLISDDKLLSIFLSVKEKKFVYRDDDKILGINKNNEGSNILGMILKNIQSLFESQKLFLLMFKPYIVYCILKHYLTVELNDYRLLKSYVDLGHLISTSKGNVDLLKKIIDEFKVSHNIKSLKTFEFENEIQNKKFCSILFSSLKDPIIIIEYTIYKYFNFLLKRMNELRKKIIFNVYVKQKFESNFQKIEKELKSVNVSKLRDIILSLYINESLPSEIKNMIDLELGKYIFVQGFSKIFTDEILTEDKSIQETYYFDSNVTFIKDTISNLKSLFQFLQIDFDSTKDLLLRIGLCKKFGQTLPKIQEPFFKSHILNDEEDKSKRHLKDLKHLLMTTRNMEKITYNDKDKFVRNFMGGYLKELSSLTKIEKYEWTEKLNDFIERDLFMSNWLITSSKYVMNFIEIIFDYIEKDENLLLENLQKILKSLGGSEEFLTQKQQDAPFFFFSIINNNFLRHYQGSQNYPEVINLIWKFIMYNVIILFNNKKTFFKTNYQARIKEVLIFFYIKLQRDQNCIIKYVEEKKEFEMLTNTVNAIFNVHKILSELKLNIQKDKVVELIASIILNMRVISKKKKKILKNDEVIEYIIENIINSNDLTGINVQQMKNILSLIEGLEVDNILKKVRINFFLNLNI